MKIAQKLGLLVGSLLVALLVAVVVLSAQINSISNGYDKLLANQVQQGQKARLMQVEFRKQVQAFNNILLRGSTVDDLTRYNKVYKAEDQQVNQLNKELIASASDSRLRASLEQFQSSHVSMDAAFRAGYDLFIASNRTDITGASDSIVGQETFPTDLIDIIVDHSEQSINEAVADQQNAVSNQLLAIYILGGLLILIAAAAATLMVRQIVRPVRTLTAAALDAANNRLPRVVAQIANLPEDAPTPTLPRFEVTTKDELAELATALTSLQDSAVGLALEQRKNEQANAETLVNLGRRNQSLLTRMLSYVTELERDERDPGVLDKLFRLDHLTTRIRRNAESLLVLAGAKQTRTWSQPIAIEDVLRAALSEIEEYTRVTVHHADVARVHGGVAADLTHMLAELLENATRFSPRERQVLVVGRLTPGGYQFDLVDAGLGMDDEELEQANERISKAGQRRPDTKVLGHHVVGRIAGRRGIFVRLLPSAQTGITAQVLVPSALLSGSGSGSGVAAVPAEGNGGAVAEWAAVSIPVDALSAPAPTTVTLPEAPALAPRPEAAAPAAPAEPAAPEVPAVTETEPAKVSEPVARGEAAKSESAEPAPVAKAEPVAKPEPKPEPVAKPEPKPEPTPAPMAKRAPATPPAPATAPAPAGTAPAAPLPAPRQEPKVAPVSATPGRRVRGAQLEGLADLQEPEVPSAPRDAAAMRSKMSSLQSGVAAARREAPAKAPDEAPEEPKTLTPAPIPAPAPMPGRRVRGAQLAELGEIGEKAEVPERDPEAIGRQLSGLQAATTRARRRAGQEKSGSETPNQPSTQESGNDKSNGSNA